MRTSSPNSSSLQFIAFLAVLKCFNAVLADACLSRQVVWCQNACWQECPVLFRTLFVLRYVTSSYYCCYCCCYCCCGGVVVTQPHVLLLMSSTRRRTVLLSTVVTSLWCFALIYNCFATEVYWSVYTKNKHSRRLLGSNEDWVSYSASNTIQHFYLKS